MLTVDTLRKVLEQHDKQTKNVKYYLFVGSRLGKVFGLRDGQLLDNGSVQVVFSKKIKVA